METRDLKSLTRQLLSDPYEIMDPLISSPHTSRVHFFRSHVQESFTFNCNPFAVPEANIVWLQNGQPIDSELLFSLP